MTKDEPIKWLLLALLVVFFGVLALLRKKITYTHCTLDNYRGRRNKGKSHYFFMFHLIFSFGLALVCYTYLQEKPVLMEWFEDTIARLGSILLLWLICIIITGLFIEKYLQSTDKEYRTWRSKYLGKS